MTTIETRTARATGLLARFASFVAERHPLALRPAVAALDILTGAQGVDEGDARAIDARDGVLRREAVLVSLTDEEKMTILRGMVLTRALDNRLKQFFTGGEVRYGNASFQGKGFRSLGSKRFTRRPRACAKARPATSS